MYNNEFIKEIIEMTESGKLLRTLKNSTILSKIVSDGDAFVSIYSTKLNFNSLYVCSRKYVEDEVFLNGNVFEKHIIDTYKHSLFIFDGVELLYFIDENNHSREYESHLVASLKSKIEHILEDTRIKNILN